MSLNEAEYVLTNIKLAMVLNKDELQRKVANHYSINVLPGNSALALPRCSLFCECRKNCKCRNANTSILSLYCWGK